MTTYQLASLLEHLQQAFGDNLKTNASASLAEAVAAFRELPDQNLRAFLTSVRRANAPQPVENAVRPSLLATIVERIRAIRAGTAPAGEVIDLSKLTSPQLKDVLREFKQTLSGNKSELLTRVRQLCVRVSQTPEEQTGASVPPTTHPDPAVVEVGIALYERLIDDRQLSIPDVRAGFMPLRDYPKPVLEEISRRVGYTPAGSREDILDRLLKNLEGLKMNQHRADRILNGTSG